ncbi:arf-GAP with Rho-GAP domain, ANK repeat and PH domain-containing protein 2 [Brienomyrus brachyistius]|uniref:arf-GAP with Rho-GAP domain, ANK repeat and PH domain-containing protein 2 n=1 Tax=Brienomyrus brachyistius TaxID=42636 RepID=UPI0020B43212|nr:arf-GAP with Rho-GAP domain, ANK repeat and PH domain-containing protein 2 [Brienomyrus brachyistius]
MSEPSEEISAWLASLRLGQYGPCLARAGYHRLCDCLGLGDQQLWEMGVLPTGHRRRILSSLETRPPCQARGWLSWGVKKTALFAPKKDGAGLEEPQITWPPSSGAGLGEAPPPIPNSTSSPLTPAEPATQSTSAPTSRDFKGTMVVNDIYEGDGCDMPAGCIRPTRSYRLKHRPVPEVPDRVSTLLGDRDSLSCQHPLPSDGLCATQEAPPDRTLAPICPYGEMFLYNVADSSSDTAPVDQPRSKNKEASKLTSGTKQSRSEKDAVSSSAQTPLLEASGRVQGGLSQQECSTEETHRSQSLPRHFGMRQVANSRGNHTQLANLDVDISPYACYYQTHNAVLKAGWLDKLSPQGNCVYQKRWVTFDGEHLCYYSNDKDMYSKGFIPLSAVSHVRSLGDSKIEVVTSHRAFVFRVEKEGERYDWINALQIAMRSQPSASQLRSKPSAAKCGYVELRGYKGRVFLSLMGTQVRLYKAEQDFKAGIGVAIVELATAHVKDVERKGFEINTPFKNFCFTAESEREKEEWIEAVQESIAETLSDYEVAEKIWFNKSNRSCADCSSPLPQWASINLGVVICKKCAGQHRSLGSSISQVRSLKLDHSIWSNELVELFLTIGNKNANLFWVANLSPEEELQPGATPERRAAFVRRKYWERRYTRTLEGFQSQEELNEALCSAVVQPDVLLTMRLVFSGADVMSATGDPNYSTPYLLAQKAGQQLQMEFLYHNKLSDLPKLDPVYGKKFPRNASFFKSGFLYTALSVGRPVLDRRTREEMVQRWCTLEGGFLSYYESEQTATAMGRMDLAEIVTLAVCRVDTPPRGSSKAAFTFEAYLMTERIFTFGTETSEMRRQWVQALAKCFIPLPVAHLRDKDYELIGRLYFKEGHDLNFWRVGWFTLEESNLYYSSGEGDSESPLGLVQLKRLQELTISTRTVGQDKMDVLLLVESGRTIYVHGFSRADFSLWRGAIFQAAGTDGRALSSQQLSKHDVPIVVESCMAFVTQYGLAYEGIYQRNGNPQRVAQLLESFQKDARSVKLRVGEQQLEDVTDVLKSFLRDLEDALLTKELYPFWVSILGACPPWLSIAEERVRKYCTLIQSLPKINRTTLGALMQHLYRIQKCSGMNQMVTHNLASVFSSCLFQTEGQMSQEVCVVEDLINNFAELFDVNEDQVKQMETENNFIMSWKDVTLSRAGDLIFEVYLEKKEAENCCLIKVSPTMRSDELADAVLSMRNVEVLDAADLWTTFETIENGELERPLYPKEKVLEQVLEWSALEDPGSAFLVIKKFSASKMAAYQQDGAKDFLRGDLFRFKDGSSKLLSGNKFQDRFVVLRDEKLLLYKDVKSTKPEREVLLRSAKCYFGLRKRIKPPTSCGFTVYTEKHQWFFCCVDKETQLKWVTEILRVKYGGEAWHAGRIHRQPVLQSNRGGTVMAVQSSMQKDEEKPKKESLPPVAQKPPEACTDISSAPFHQRMALVADTLKQKDTVGCLISHRKKDEAMCQVSRWQLGSLVRQDRTQSKMATQEQQSQLVPSLLQELSSVLSKSGRAMRDDPS